MQRARFSLQDLDMWDSVHEWLYRVHNMVSATLYNAVTLPQSLDEFLANPLIFFFHYDSSKRRLFEQMSLRFVKRAGDGTNGTIRLPIPHTSLVSPHFSTYWSEQEKWIKKMFGEDCKGVGGYFVGIVRVGTEVPRFIPFVFPALASLHRKVPLIRDWEQRMITHSHCLAMSRELASST